MIISDIIERFTDADTVIMGDVSIRKYYVTTWIICIFEEFYLISGYLWGLLH